MSFISTDLSETDLHNLKNIFIELEKITLPTVFTNVDTIPRRFHANRTGTFNQKNARQTCFGITTYRGQKRESKYTKKYPQIMPLFEIFIKSHHPEFKFTSVYVNRNTVCKQHLDSRNVGESLLVGFGDYTGGETFLLSTEELKFDISKKSLIFNGSKIPHGSEPFIGTRYSLVFFNS